MMKKKGYTNDDLRDVADNPEWTETDFATARPLAAMLPDLADSIRRGRGLQKAPTKTKVNLRLDQGVIEHFKASGKGWQVRMGDVLKKAAGL